jgi:hypothetical protein
VVRKRERERLVPGLVREAAVDVGQGEGLREALLGSLRAAAA